MEVLVTEAVRWVTFVLEIGGIAAIVIGAVIATGLWLKQVARGQRTEAFGCYRTNLGRSILLGLELLVAADIVNTVAVDPSLDSLAILAGIVLIRTFLSFSLEVELEGSWPWQRARRKNAE